MLEERGERVCTHRDLWHLVLAPRAVTHRQSMKSHVEQEREEEAVDGEEGVCVCGCVVRRGCVCGGGREGSVCGGVCVWVCGEERVCVWGEGGKCVCVVRRGGVCGWVCVCGEGGREEIRGKRVQLNL